MTEIVNTPASTAPPVVFIVGAGETGRQVAVRLARSWRVRLLDLDPPNAIEVDDSPETHPIELVQGDGTSRLVLQRAGIAEATVLIATTGDDTINLECARIARETFAQRRIFVVLRDHQRSQEAMELGVEPIFAAAAVSSIICGRVDPTLRPAVGIGLGQGEIIEVTLLESSKAIGRPLREIGARDWLVAAVYRGDQLVVPHGHTVLQKDDRVVLAGRPEVLPAIAEYFRAGTPSFPLPYGRRLVAVTLGPATLLFWNELRYLLHHTRTTGLDVFGPESPPDDPPHIWHRVAADDALAAALAHPEGGCLILPPESAIAWWAWHRRRPSLLPIALTQARQPVLVARGTFPYRRTMLPIGIHQANRAVAELAIGLSAMLGAALTGIVVTPPPFVIGPRAIDDELTLLDEFTELAQVHRVALSSRHVVGNPIRSVLRFASNEADLVVIGTQTARRWPPFRIDVGAEIARRGSCSTLILPVTTAR